METVETWMRLQSKVLYRQRPLLLPTSFLLDDESRLMAIYQGPVSAEQVIADAKLSSRTETPEHQSFPFPGRSGLDLLPITPVDISSAYEEGQYFEEAEEELIRFLVKTRRGVNENRITPNRDLALELERTYVRLTQFLTRRGRRAEALAVAKQGLEMMPSSKKIREAASSKGTP